MNVKTDEDEEVEPEEECWTNEEDRVSAAETGTSDKAPSEHHQPHDDQGAATSRPQAGNVINYFVLHLSQTCFTCPDTACRLTYPTHASLVCHVGVSHKGIHFEYLVQVRPLQLRSLETVINICPLPFDTV